MADTRFVCNAVETFDLSELRARIQAQQVAGQLPSGRPIRVEVRHPDREMDGSCRWCGCRENEVIDI